MSRKIDGKHPVPCLACGAKTYRKACVCKRCERRDGSMLPKPDVLPESYLLLCVEEMVKRHNHRAALMEQLGIRVRAA
jgi:hypothetical protein